MPKYPSSSDSTTNRGPNRRTWTFIAVAVTLVLCGTVANSVAARSVQNAAPQATFTADAPVDPETPTAPDVTPTVAVHDSSVTDTTALALLAELPVKGKAPNSGYDRTEVFGAAWLDVDHNGCDTRNDILARDLTDLTFAGSCRVLSGTLAEPYTGKTIDFVRGTDTSAIVQIDHVVSLSNAWRTGAAQLSQAERVSLANDPLNLLAADGRSNLQKRDGDAATWLPSAKSFRCDYVARQISVKATYGLWVTPAEHDAMERILSGCSDQPALTSTFASTPVQPEIPAVVESAPAPVTSTYANCAAVREAGAAPLYANQPGYAAALDGDGDGIACE